MLPHLNGNRVGIPSFDELIGGGFPRGSITLVLGDTREDNMILCS